MKTLIINIFIQTLLISNIAAAKNCNILLLPRLDYEGVTIEQAEIDAFDFNDNISRVYFKKGLLVDRSGQPLTVPAGS